MNFMAIALVGGIIGIFLVGFSSLIAQVVPWIHPVPWERAFLFGLIVELASRVLTVQKELAAMRRIQDHKYLRTSDGPCGYLIRKDPPQWCGKPEDQHATR